MIIEFILAVGSILAFLYWYNGNRHPQFPPGLWRFPVIGSAPFMRTPMHKHFIQLSEKYGKVFSLYIANYPTVVISDANLIREAFKLDAFSGRPELRMFTERSWGKKRGIIFNDGPDWQLQRRFVLKNLRDMGFGKKSMENMIQEQVSDFVEHLKKSENEPMSVMRQFNLPVLNALWYIISGQRFALDDQRLKTLINKLSDNFLEKEPNGALFFMPWLTKLAPNLSGWNEFMSVLEPTLGFLNTPIQEHKETFSPDNLRDLIDIYLNEISKTTDPSSSFYKDDGEKSIQIVLLDLFAAGAETVSTTLTFSVLFLQSFTEIQVKLQKEIDAVIGLNRIPSLNDRPNLHYMEAFIAETLRYSSFTPLGLFHGVTETVTFHGHVIPEGTIVFSNQWQVHHDPAIWGDPNNFRPERFLDDNGHFQPNENLIPFSVGKRVCLGEKLARDELFLFLTGLLQKLTFERENTGKPPCVDMSETGLTLKPKPFKTIIRRRNT